MRKTFTLIVLLLCLKNVKAQYVTIPDVNFRNWLQSNIPSAMIGNQMDTTSLAITTRTIVSIGFTNISDLTGIQYFDALSILECESNFLSTLPRLPNTLTYLTASFNQLTNLPTLPNSLITIEVVQNNLTNLPLLPNALVSLHCARNNLSNLPSLPNTLIDLYCSVNTLSVLPTLPNGLNELTAESNQLTNLPSLPTALKTLRCNSNYITNLPTLNAGLLFLSCGNNLLTNLPILPNSLTTLYCAQNDLVSLPTLPQSLTDLDCRQNLLTQLPGLPNAIQSLSCSYNNINCFLTFPSSLTTIEIDNNYATCLPNYLPDMDLATLAIPLCSAGNANGCPVSGGIIGYVYTDKNSNCLKDSGDIELKNIPVKIYDGLNNLLGQTYSAINGLYYFPQTFNTYNVVVDTTNIPFTQQCIYPGLDSTVTVGANGGAINFNLICKPSFDLGIQAIGHTQIVFPGEAHTINISAGLTHLYCTSNISGTVTFTISGPVTYFSPAPGALTPAILGNVYTYSVGDFSTINNINDFRLLFITNPIATAGNSITIVANIDPIIGDNDLSNNTSTHSYLVYNSHDPNIKEVYPIDVQPGFNDWLTYSIHFQNTGNAPAFNIRLADTLDNMLDLETFQVINYSHQNIIDLTGNILNVRFPNIMLPDSTSNPSGSIGYIQYRIKPKATWAAPYKIKNTAYIYFDYNSPIVTNSTYNSILVPTGLNNQTEALAALYPNPTNGTFTIELNSKEKQLLQVFDITGNEVLSQTIENGKSIVDANHLAAGIYNISIKGSSVINKKLVIVR